MELTLTAGSIPPLKIIVNLRKDGHTKWPKHNGGYPVINVHQNTIVHLLVLILYSKSHIYLHLLQPGYFNISLCTNN